MSMAFYLPGRMNGDELFSFYFFITLIAASLICKKKREINAKLLGVILMVAIGTTILNFTTVPRANLINWLVGILAFKAIVENISVGFKEIGAALSVFFAVNLGFIAYQAYVGANEYTGLFGLLWIMGSAACISIPFVQAKSKWLCLLLVPALFFSHSSICILTAIILFCIPALIQNQKLILPSVLAGCGATLLYIVFYDNGVDSARVKVIFQSAQHIHNALIGNGIGSFAHSGFAKLNGLDWTHWRWAHNELFQYLFEQGLIGAGLVSAWFSGLFKAKNVYALSGVIGVFILSMFHPIFHFGNLIVLVLVVLAMAETTTKRGEYGV